MNYYVVLGIAEDADEETIRSAFRALARRYHPDVGVGSRLLNSSALAKHMRRSLIPNAVAGTTGNCETPVPSRSWFHR
jgi:DnaJ domain